MSPVRFTVAFTAALLLAVAAAEAESCTGEFCAARGVMLMQQRPGTLTPARRGSPLHTDPAAATLSQESVGKPKHDAKQDGDGDKDAHKRRSAQEARLSETKAASAIDKLNAGQESADEPKDHDDDDGDGYKYDYNPRRNGSAEQLPRANVTSWIDKLAANVTNDRKMVEDAISKLKAAQKEVDKQKAAEKKAAEKAAEKKAIKANPNRHAPEEDVPGTHVHGHSHKMVIIGVGVSLLVLLLACGIAACCHSHMNRSKFDDSDSDEEEDAAPVAKKPANGSKAAPAPAPASTDTAADGEAAKKLAEEEAAKKLAEEEAAKKKKEEEEAAKAPAAEPEG